jgi:hypothetical protein
MLASSPRRHKVDQPYDAIFSDEVGFQDQSVLSIATLDLDHWNRRGDGPMSVAGIPNDRCEASI